MSPFTLSIEETAGKSRQHGFHLGTDENLARALIEEKMQAFHNFKMPIITMALMRNRKIIDVLYPDGIWESEKDAYDSGYISHHDNPYIRDE